MNLLKSIQWSPSLYRQTAIVAHIAGKELLSRLAWLKINPLRVLDMGCGPGDMSALLKQQYPHACVIALDVAESMLRYAGQQNAITTRLCADAGSLPCKDQSIDLIFANLVLPWCQDLAALFQEWRRVLKPDGLLMFTAFGLETAKEWTHIIGASQLPLTLDMHDYGDLLMQTGFADPVLDVDYYTLTYKNKVSLLQELYASLVWFPSDQEMESVFKSNEPATLAVTYEMIFANAFAPFEKKQKAVVKIPIQQVRRQLFPGKT